MSNSNSFETTVTELEELPNNTVIETPLAAITNEHWKLFVTLVSISSTCLVFTLSLYVLIWKKHNCHGWTQFSYLLSLFLFDCVFIPALCPGLTSGGNDRNVLCFALAVANQYFFICAKTWLIIISFDIYFVIRNIEIIAAQTSKHLRRFTFYSLIGWTFPLIFVTAGVIINLTNRQSLYTKTVTEVGSLWPTVPDYGFLHCRIPNWLVWECFVFTNCLFHFFMFALIIVTIARQRGVIARASLFSNIGQPSPIILLVRLFIVVGLSWSYIALQDLLNAGNINTNQSWGWHIFRCVYFLQGAFISVITLTHGRTTRNLTDKFPSLKAIQIFNANPFRKLVRTFRHESRKESFQSCSSQQTTTTSC